MLKETVDIYEYVIRQRQMCVRRYAYRHEIFHVFWCGVYHALTFLRSLYFDWFKFRSRTCKLNHSLVGVAVAAAVDEEEAVLGGTDVVRDGDAHLMPPHRACHQAVCRAQQQQQHQRRSQQCYVYCMASRVVYIYTIIMLSGKMVALRTCMYKRTQQHNKWVCVYRWASVVTSCWPAVRVRSDTESRRGCTSWTCRHRDWRSRPTAWWCPATSVTSCSAL